ncbi:MAG: alginate lyase family protein, partial [Gemmatimonas sp.]
MLSRLRGRSRPELLTRARQQVLAIGERYGIAGVAGRVPEFRSDLPASSDHWTVSRFAPPRLPLGAESVDAVGAAIRDAWPEVAAGYVANATRIDRGELSLMGHAGLQLGSPPDWHEEPIARVRSPRAHWSTIPYLERHVVGDHKVLWEFNRHQYFVSLAQAWAVSGDAQCVRLFMAHMNSWIAANPPHLGVNWASSLEVAYRAISWCWALRMFRHADGIDAAFMQRVYASLDAHGRHIERYLSTYFSPNTHLTGEALGLLYLGATFPELARSETWRTCGSRILDEQARRQVYSDGVYFEQATQYHRYTTEIYLHYLLLAEASGDAASPVVRPVLHRLFDVLLALTRADGTMPLIGDDDGGRLVQLDDRRPDQLRGLLAVGAVVLDRSDLARAGGDPDYLAWMLGADAIDRWLELRSMSSATPLRCAFPVGGLFVMREDEPDSPDHVVIDAGPHGALSCGHSHADALSVVVSCGGGPLFVDAGTYTYVGAERNQFRGASVHNLFTVDGRAPSQPASPFRWETRSDGRMTEWHRTPDFSWIRGIESAYQDAVPSLRHERCVFRPRGGVIVIRDAIVGGASTSARLRWQCAADVEPALRSRTGTATVID